MKLRMFAAVCLLPITFGIGLAQAQGAVVESVDEDIVEEVTPPAVTDATADKDAAVYEDTSAAAAKDSSTAVTVDKAEAEKSTKKKGLDLDALLDGDDDDDLLIADKPVSVPSGADSSEADSAPLKTGGLADGEAAADADSAGAGRGGRGSRGRVAASSGQEDKAPAAKVDSADLGPVIIEDGKAINFAHNLKEYRSPRIAMLLSLLVPGLGQAYARNYVKAGAFGAAEVAAIGTAVYFNSVAKSKKKDAYRFADRHFDVDRMIEYDSRLQEEFDNRVEDLGDIDIGMLPLLQYDSLYTKDVYGAAGKPYFYDNIRYNRFTPGWDDNEPSFDEILKLSGELIGDTLRLGSGGRYVLSELSETPGPADPFFYLIVRVVDAAAGKVDGPMLGYSVNQGTYNSMMNKANSYHDAVTYTVYALLLNHIASAVDAGFTARAYNARLLGQGSSAWDRVSVEQQYVFTGSEVSPGLALKVRF